MDINDSGTDLGAGSVEHEPQLLTVPEEPDDVLAKTRQDAVWWGLVGGGALLLAVVLRPVLARRRRTVSR
jgi:membrane-anchored mycosin MYCP